MDNKFNFNTIKKIRKQKKISLKNMAVLCGLSLPSLIDIENNRGNPTLKTLTRISEVLEFPLSTMMHLVEQHEPVITDFEIYRKEQRAEILFHETNMYKFVIAHWPKGTKCTDPGFHEKDLNESFIILQGKIKITVNDYEYMVEKNQIIQFPAKYQHTYCVLEDVIACGFFCKESPFIETY